MTIDNTVTLISSLKNTLAARARGLSLLKHPPNPRLPSAVLFQLRHELGQFPFSSRDERDTLGQPTDPQSIEHVTTNWPQQGTRRASNLFKISQQGLPSWTSQTSLGEPSIRKTTTGEETYAATWKAGVCLRYFEKSWKKNPSLGNWQNEFLPVSNYNKYLASVYWRETVLLHKTKSLGYHF